MTLFLRAAAAATSAAPGPQVEPPLPTPRETYDIARPDALDRIDDELADPRALDDDVRGEADAVVGPRVVGGSQKARHSAMARDGPVLLLLLLLLLGSTSPRGVPMVSNPPTPSFVGIRLVCWQR